MTDLNCKCQPRAPAARALLVLLGALGAAGARADILESVNAVRAAGCSGGVKGSAPLTTNAQLDEVARRMAGGASLRSAQQLAGYHAISAYLVSIDDVPADGDVRHIVETQFCAQSTNPHFRELGIYRQGAQAWLTFAEPFTPPDLSDAGTVAARVLELVNAARASARRCGNAAYPAAPPLSRSALLERAAQDYARDMATFSYMDHTGRDGSLPQERITRSGYRWSETAENLGSGSLTPEMVVLGWLGSPSHCANLMDGIYREAGVGFAIDPRNEVGVYWALELARPAAGR